MEQKQMCNTHQKFINWVCIDQNCNQQSDICEDCLQQYHNYHELLEIMDIYQQFEIREINQKKQFTILKELSVKLKDFSGYIDFVEKNYDQMVKSISIKTYTSEVFAIQYEQYNRLGQFLKLQTIINDEHNQMIENVIQSINMIAEKLHFVNQLIEKIEQTQKNIKQIKPQLESAKQSNVSIDNFTAYYNGFRVISNENSKIFKLENDNKKLTLDIGSQKYAFFGYPLIDVENTVEYNIKLVSPQYLQIGILKSKGFPFGQYAFVNNEQEMYSDFENVIIPMKTNVDFKQGSTIKIVYDRNRQMVIISDQGGHEANLSLMSQNLENVQFYILLTAGIIELV